MKTLRLTSAGIAIALFGLACLTGAQIAQGQTVISGSPWQPIKGPWSSACNGTFGAIAIAPSNPNVIYLGSSDLANGCGIFKSTDGGQSWTTQNTGIVQVGLFSQHYPPITTIATTEDPSVLYIGTYAALGGSVYRTSDAGAHWNAASGPVNFWGNAQISNAVSMAADPTNANIVYAGLLATGVYKSSNGGQQWQQIRSGGASDVFHIVRFVDNYNLVTAGGTTYNDTPCVPIPTPTLDTLGCSGSLPIGPAISSDGGKSWVNLTYISDIPVNSVFFSALESTQSQGVWTSFASTMAAGILVGPIPDIIGSKGVFRVDASGTIWDKLPVVDGMSTNPPIVGLAIDNENPSHLFCNVVRGGIYGSQNGGSAWSSVPLPIGATQVNTFQASGNRLFAATDAGIFMYNYAPQFSATINGGSRIITQGQSTTFTLTISSSHGFNSTVTPAAINLPPGASASWTSQSITPPANGQATSTLDIVTGPTTSTGTFTTTIRSSAFGYATQDIPVTVTINKAADFSTSVDTTSRTITQGQSTTFTVTVKSLNGFSSPVSLAAINLPPGYSSAYWNSPSVTPSANGQVTGTLTINTTTGTSTGSFTTTLRASASGYTTKDIPVVITINKAADFSTSVDSTARTITQGQSTTFTVTVKSLNGFNSPVSLAAINLPPGYSSAYWNSPSVTPSANGQVTGTLTINTTTGTSTGSFTTTLRASASGYTTKDIPVVITINKAADFSTSVDSTARTITQGQSTTFTVTVKSLNGFNSPVSLAAINLPPGYSSAYWSSPSVTPSANGQVTGTLTINTATGTSTGSFTTTLRASASGYTTKDIPVVITINKAADFSTSVDTTARTITQGQSTTFTVTVKSLNGFNSPVSLAAINLPPGYSSAYWNSPSVTPSANGQVTGTLTINTTTGTSTGSFTTTLRASASGYATKDIPVIITIQKITPSVSRISPTSPSKKAGNQAVSVYGSNFQSGLTVTVVFPNGSRSTLSGTGQIQAVSSTGFTMIVNFNNNAGLYSIIVNNPGGTGSNAFSFFVQ